MTSFLASSCKGVNVSIEFSLLMLLEGALSGHQEAQNFGVF